MNINLGYCCVSVLHEELKCSRASTKTYLEKMNPEKRHDYLVDKAKANIDDLIALLKQNHKEEIMAYRVPEQIVPQIDLGYYSLEDVRSDLERAGKVANDLGMQLSSHPSQYFVLNSLREEVVARTIASLNAFADMFALMKLDKVPNLTLHLGMKNGYETPDKAVQVFADNYKRLNENARKYLVIENDHVSFTVEECMKLHEMIHIPVVFDNKHYEWNPGELEFDEAVGMALETWGSRIPKLHLSSDKEGKKHAHSDYIELSDYNKMKKAVEKSNISECYFMLECKQKDKAVLELRKEIAKRALR